MKRKIEIGYKVSYKTPEDTHSGWYKDGIQSIEDAVIYANNLKTENCRDIIISKYTITTITEEEIIKY